MSVDVNIGSSEYNVPLIGGKGTRQAGLIDQTLLGFGIGTLSNSKSISSSSTVGNITVTAAELAGGYFADLAVQTAAATLTTDTAANILNAFPNANVNDSFIVRIYNNPSAAYDLTLAGGSGVTVETTPIANPAIAAGSYADFLFVFTGITTPALSVYSVS